MINRLSAGASAFGFLGSLMLLAVAIDKYRAGASLLWLVAGVAIFLSACYTLVRDVRGLRGPAS
ncbi:hypothetical protein [Streptomyces sp. NPDC046385]|uniref:hypothetical protein n=1 Tax=Streptomyces sp. NPDC046385 TaxID=3154918 RepID=UPI0033F24168